MSSCNNIEKSSTLSIFQPHEISEVEKVDSFKLGFANKAGISHVTYKETINPSAYTESKKYSYRFHFGKISKPEYDKLMENYGGKGYVQWNPEKDDWRLLDFLPPKIQALNGKWLHGTSELEARIPEGWRNPYSNFAIPSVHITMNCYTTTHEILRDWSAFQKGTLKAKDQVVQIGYFSGVDAFSAISDPEHHASVTHLSQEEIKGGKDSGRNDCHSIGGKNVCRKVGDLLVIHTIGSLDISPAHSAIWIDEDLYFEKTNSGSDEPFRLSIWEDAVAPYLEQEVDHYPVKMAFYDVQNAENALPNQKTFANRPAFEIDDSVLPEDLQDLIFALDIGFGGSLKEYSANRVIDFKMRPNSKTGRAELINADNPNQYLKGDKVCWSSNYGTDDYFPFQYEITRDSHLKVYNEKGVVADILVKTAEKGESIEIDGEDNKLLFKAKSGEKFLSLYKDSSNGIYLSHPGQSHRIFMNCVFEKPELLEQAFYK